MRHHPGEAAGAAGTAGSGFATRRGAERAERWLVYLIALHSVAVGAMLLFLPAWSAAFGGWGEASPLFFARQAGAFHFVVAFAYVYEYLRYRGVTILVVTKATAFTFLMTVALLGEPAWSVALSGVADGGMGLVVWAVHRRVVQM